MREVSKKSMISTGVKMKDLPKKRQVELHAYWPREAFSSAPSQGLNEDDLSNFKRVEIEIKADKVHAKVMIKWIFPIFFIALLLVTFYYYREFSSAYELLKRYIQRIIVSTNPQWTYLQWFCQKQSIQHP